MLVNSISYKAVLQNVSNIVVVPRTKMSVAVAMIVTTCFHYLVAHSDQYKEDFDIYAEGKVSATAVLANAFLLAVPGILRYLLSPTHLDSRLPYNDKDLFRVGSYVAVIHLVICAVKYVWKKYNLPIAIFVSYSYIEKIDQINTKLNKLTEIEARLASIEGGGIEGALHLEKKVSDARPGEITPPREDLNLIIIEKGGSGSPNPGATPRIGQISFTEEGKGP